jgi:hypothetical protein
MKMVGALKYQPSRQQAGARPGAFAVRVSAGASGRRENREASARDRRLSTAGRPVAASLLLALALTGCATTRYAPTYCLSHNQALPAEPPKVHNQLTGQADRDLEIVSGSAIRLRSWGEGLETILEGCREPNK